MPFSSTKTYAESEWTEIYENVFKPAVEDCGYSCERAMPGTGSLIKSIIEKLRDSTVVLSDITDMNPNVLYELGVRHSLSKRTIIVSQRIDDIPSDLRGYWSVIYGTKPGEVAKFKADIRRIISEIDENPGKSDSPVSDFLDRENQQRLPFNNNDYYKYGAQLRQYNQLLAEQEREMLLFRYEINSSGDSDESIEGWRNYKRAFTKEEIFQGQWIKIAHYIEDPRFGHNLEVQCYPDGTLTELELFYPTIKRQGLWRLIGPVLRINVDTYELDVFANLNSDIHSGVEICEENPKEPFAYFKVIHVLPA